MFLEPSRANRIDTSDNADRDRFPGPVPARDAESTTAYDVSLIVIDGEPFGRRIPVGSAPIVIGRGAGVDLRIKDPTVSRHHCVIWYASGRCWVRDLGSTNRTRVNDSTALMAQLHEGDVLVVGHTALMLSVDHSHGGSKGAPSHSRRNSAAAQAQVSLRLCDETDDAG